MLTDNAITQVLIDSLKELAVNDSYLIAHDVHERTICAHLASYLEKRFKEDDSELSVDCEYNRDGFEPKSLSFLSGETKDVYPDIIVHKRGSNDYNTLVLEVKKAGFTTDEGRNDIEKLRAFTSNDADSHYRYQVGFFLVLKYDSENQKLKYEVRQFVNGKELEGNSLTLLANEKHIPIYKMRINDESPSFGLEYEPIQ